MWLAKRLQFCLICPIILSHLEIFILFSSNTGGIGPIIIKNVKNSVMRKCHTVTHDLSLKRFWMVSLTFFFSTIHLINQVLNIPLHPYMSDTVLWKLYSCFSINKVVTWISVILSFELLKQYSPWFSLLHVQCGAHNFTKLPCDMFVLFKQAEWLMKDSMVPVILIQIKHLA